MIPAGPDTEPALLLDPFLIAFLIPFALLIGWLVYNILFVDTETGIDRWIPVPSWKKRKRDLEFERVWGCIDESVRGFRRCERVKHRQYASWKCVSKLYLLDIILQRTGSGLSVSATLVCSVTLPIRITGRGVIPETLDAENFLKQKDVAPLLERIRFFDSVEVRNGQVLAARADTHLMSPESWHDGLGGLITFVRLLHQHENRTSPSTGGAAVCPYCRDVISGDKSAVACGVCRTVHHEECWHETGRCSVFGCSSRSMLQLQ